MKHIVLTGLIAVTFLVTPFHSTQAATNQNQALIEKLLAQIVVLQAELAKLLAQQGGTPTCTFTRLLVKGTQGTDVTCLQNYLKSKGHFTAIPTGLFGPVTESAVATWQRSEGIVAEPWEYGRFGEQSRGVYARSIAVVSLPPTPTTYVAEIPRENKVPVIRSYTPQDVVPYANSIPITVTTNIPATCRYGTNSEVYASLPTQFTGINTTLHTASLSLPVGTTRYQYYVRCTSPEGVESKRKRVEFLIRSETAIQGTSTESIPATTLPIEPPLPPQTRASIRYAIPTDGAIIGPCTELTPCTLGRAVSLSTTPGDITYLYPGRYSEGINTSGNGTKSSPIVFDCLENRGKCILVGYAPGSTDRIIAMDTKYVRVKNMTIIPPPLMGTHSTFGVRMEAWGEGNQVTDSEVYSEIDSDKSDTRNLQWAIQARGTDFVIARNTIHNVNVGINANSDTSAPEGLIAHNTIYDLDQGDEEDSDCINYGSIVRNSSYDLIIEHNECSGYRDDGIDAIGASRIIVQNNWIHTPGQSTNSNSGIKMGGNKDATGPSTENIYRSNFVDMRNGGTQRDYCAVSNGLTDGLIYGNIMVTDDSGACFEIGEWGLPPFGGGDGNSIINNVFVGGSIGIYVRKGASNTVVKNNILAGTVSDINVETGVVVTGAHNNLGGTGLQGGQGVYNPTNDIKADPQFVGGPLPTTADGFRLRATSPLRGMGEDDTEADTDYIGTRFSNPRSIGAYEASDTVTVVPNVVPLTSSQTDIDMLQYLLNQLDVLEKEVRKLKN